MVGDDDRILEGEGEAQRHLAGPDRGGDVEARRRGGQRLVDQLDLEHSELGQRDALAIGHLAAQIDFCGEGRAGERKERESERQNGFVKRHQHTLGNTPADSGGGMWRK